MWAAEQRRVLFHNCGDTLRWTHPASDSQERALIPALTALEADAMTAGWGFAITPASRKQRPAEHGDPMLVVEVAIKR